MKHNHNHSCTCEHKNVKYCSHCLTVYCQDCNQEWTAKSYWNFQPYYTTYAYPNTIGTGNLNYQSSSTTTITDPQLTTTVCSHKH